MWRKIWVVATLDSHTSSPSSLLSRPGSERPRVGPSSDEELPERNARVQIRHEWQDCHRQAGQGRSVWRSREEVSDTARRLIECVKWIRFLITRLNILLDHLQFSFFVESGAFILFPTWKAWQGNLLLNQFSKRPPCLLAPCLCYECCLAVYNKTGFTIYF